MTDPNRLLQDVRELTEPERRALEAARDLRPPSHFAGGVWTALAGKLPGAPTGSSGPTGEGAVAIGWCRRCWRGVSGRRRDHQSPFARSLSRRRGGGRQNHVADRIVHIGNFARRSHVSRHPSAATSGRENMRPALSQSSRLRIQRSYLPK